MMTVRQAGLAALLLITVAAPVQAGTESRIGTGGAMELRLPVDAHYIALGGSALASVTGVGALFYNPAGLAAGDARTEVVFSSTKYIADIHLNYVAVAQKFGSVGAVGISAKILSIGDIERTTEEAPDGTGDVFSPTFSTLGFTYARQMTDRVNFGGTVYYVAERILQETAGGTAFDFGFQYDTGFRGLGLGMAMKNVGPTYEFSGSDFEVVVKRPGDDPNARGRTVSATSAPFELPTSFQFGGSIPLMPQGGIYRTNLYTAYQSNSFARDEYHAGLEWMYRDVLGVRAGWQGTGNSDDLFGITYGLGLKVPVGDSKLFVDYAGQSVSDFFDDVQNISLRFVF